MIRQPQTGDRVRLRTPDFEPDYRPGDSGTVVSGPQLSPSGGCFFVVTLDKHGPNAAGIILHAGEIEVEPTMHASG